jgi:hypothetical protein
MINHYELKEVLIPENRMLSEEESNDYGHLPKCPIYMSDRFYQPLDNAE